ncbi:MAG: ABC transporter substrate-binding protein [Acidimicrobiales bacterium]
MVKKRRLWRVLAVFAGLTLLAGACGDDDDDDGAGGDTTTTGGETTTTAGDGGGGELQGMKGTTPAPETTDAVTDFQARMDAHDTALDDYAYGPETYDSVVIIALATEVAGDDGSAHASEIVNVTKGGEQCSSYEECLPLVQAGTDIDYEGVSGPTDMSGNGEPLLGSYSILSFGADNRIDDELTEFRSAEAGEDFQTMANDPVTVQRAGDGVLTIGTLLPETGNLAFLGPPEIAGAELAIEDINAAGGTLGQPVVLLPGDSGDTTTDIATQTVTGHLQQGADAIVGAASSSVSASVIDQITTAGVTMFSPANTSKQFSDYPDEGLYFRLGPSDILQGQVLAEVVADDGHQAVVVLNFDDDYGNGLADDFIESFESTGGEVLDHTVYDPQTQTFDAEVGTVTAADPDAVILIGFEESARLLAALVEQGVGPRDLPAYGVDGNIGNALGENFEAAS